MSKRDYITRFLLIIKKLRNSKVATFNEINDYIEREFDIMDSPKNISLRTFQRDLNEIRSIFNIDIHCNNLNQYYIEEDEHSGFNNRIMEAFDTFNALNIADKLSTYIHFEKRRPLGTENLYGLLHAIKNQIQIKFTYQKYWAHELTERIVEPYALKEFKNRWYVLANDLKDNQVKSFSLDRLTELEITKRKFQSPVDFNVNEHYKFCFGIISPNGLELQEVILSFDPLQGKYIKSLPLHESQQVLIDNEEELRVKLTLFITHDFFMELLSYGENLKIIKPDSLIVDITNSLQRTLKLY